MEKKNKIALVTGASGGIGLEFARQLAARNYDIVLVSRNKEKLAKVKAELETQYNVKGHIIPCDLSRPGSARNLYDNYKQAGIGDLDILVNNAGSGISGESIYQSLDEVDGLMNLNIVSLTDLCILFGRDMATNKAGAILNVGSIAGRNAVPYFASYAASKWYVLGYSLALAAELKSMGVTVTCLLPGFIRTDFDTNARITSDKYKRMAYNAGMMPDKVARMGLRALFRKKVIYTTGLGNKLTSFFTQFVPKTISSRIMKGYLDRILH